MVPAFILKDCYLEDKSSHLSPVRNCPGSGLEVQWPWAFVYSAHVHVPIPHIGDFRPRSESYPHLLSPRVNQSLPSPTFTAKGCVFLLPGHDTSQPNATDNKLSEQI